MMTVLDTIFRESNRVGIREIVLGMPHRGRLNLLADLLQFPLASLFHKVKGNNEFLDDEPATGDVISHLYKKLYSVAQTVDLSYGFNDKIKVSLLNNPSHLEAVNPVAMGEARARQMNMLDNGDVESDCQLGDRVLCVQLHGDAAFCGQGVVTESLGLSNLPHFTSGGSIHVIVNNQIGYTTPAMNARSSIYTSDVGKMIACPVIHVNADYPEDVAHAASIASEYRNKFKKDVILDMIAYRRWGHNELDEPAFTQPNMYLNIRNRLSVPSLYEKELMISSPEIFPKGISDIEEFRSMYFTQLETYLAESYDYKPSQTILKGRWEGLKITKDVSGKSITGVDLNILRKIGKDSVAAPEGMTLHPRLKKYHIEPRIKKIESGKNLDWATGEALAFGTLLLEGYDVRISGQDVGRGTFSQRHAMFVDQNTEKVVIPFNHMASKDHLKIGKIEIANSSLSEFAVMGFEYGMSTADPSRLVLWEAQFGDFFNGAQIIIDTYISSGESKWLMSSGIVLLLPHGYDGAGPEHSSARIERFLQICDQKFDVNSNDPDNPNIQIVYPTTPAQYFHVLRRQMHRRFRKPLVIFTPKILLRHPAAVSEIELMGPGTSFLPILFIS
ncbi:putative 2-oxoglutarate dehydrogenase E1 component DHKTD1, mitochondrial, partial [Nowakowskiella sp. JEL0078]